MPEQAAVVPLSIEQQRSSVVSLGLMPDPIKPRGVDPKHAEFINKLISSQQRIQQMGHQPVTIVNLNPYNLVVNGPLFDGLVVKACKDGEDYSALVISDVRYQVDTGTDHNHTPVEYWPIQIANEFMTQYRDKGGVFFIKGDLQQNPELAFTSEFKTNFHQAREQLYVFAFKMKVAGDTEWARPNKSGRSNVHAQHRMMARILFNARKIAKMPEWEDALIPTEDIVPVCPVCKSEPKKGALLCVVCGEILDPAGALKAGTIPETHRCLERLTRAEVVKLGVSAYVAETSDEVEERLANGDPKPLSLFERKQMAAQAVEQEADANKKAKK